MRARTGLVLTTTAGLVIATALVLQAGLASIGDALADLTWLGLVWLCVLQIGSLALCAAAWWLLADGASFPACLTARWVRDGSSNLVSIVPGVGEVAGARALTLFGAAGGAAAASTIVDVAIESVSQAIYTGLGLVPLLGFLARAETWPWVGGLAAAMVPGVAVYFVTRHKPALLLVERLIRRAASAVGFADLPDDLGLAHNVRLLHADGRRVLTSTILHLLAWGMGAVQVWAAARAMGLSLSPGGALALESLVYAARGILFMVPWGAGVQETTFVVVGAMVGIGEASALALSIALRARDLLLGVPAVLLWSAAEGRESWLKFSRSRSE